MDTSDPEIRFNSLGHCNHCISWYKNETARKEDFKNFKSLIQKIKEEGEGKTYDCLIGLSGGVDSSLTLHYALELGLRPLAFQIDNGWNNTLADSNVFNLVERLKVPFYRWTIDVEKFREAQKALIKGGIKNLEVLTDHILFASTYEMASKYGIKYVLSGGNHATEGIMPVSYGEDPRDLHWIKSIYYFVTGKRLKGLPMISLLREQYLRLVKGITTVRLLDYYDYNREQAKEILKEKYKWRDYGEKHCESKFTQWYQSFYLPRKFGIDKRRPHFSSLICSGQMVREEALEELKKEPKYELLGWEDLVFNSPVKSYQDYPNSENVRKIVIKLYKVWRYLQRQKKTLVRA